jgi:tetratricopeptide (TPR) repeat protein
MEIALKCLLARCLDVVVVTAQVLGIVALEAQTIESQPVTKEVALALQQEKQASELAAQGRAAEAEALYKQSLATIEQSLPGDEILAGSLNNVAQFYRAQRRFSEAAELFNRALAIYVASYGDNHTLTVTVINNLAGSYLSDRKFDAAEPLYKRGLAATEKLLGPDHYGVAISLDWLAQTNFFQGRYAEAEVHLKRGITVAEKSTGPESQLVVRLLDHLISVVKAQGREQEATALKERAQQIIAKSPKR